MGANKWISKVSLKKMSNDSLVYFLSENKLVENKPKGDRSLALKIDFKDRSKMNNADYYPSPIIKDSIDLTDGLIFTSEPFEKECIINGSFSGKLSIIANKKDFDFAVTLYELTPEGKYFHLGYYIGRAS